MKKLDYKNTNLVAFGDSFTFGQGIYPIPDDGKSDVQLSWREKSNNVSYAKIVSNICNFKSYENYGIPGNSNNGMLNNIRSYYENNKTNKDVFYLIGLTHPDRDFMMRYIDHCEMYDSYNFSWNNWLIGVKQNRKRGFDSPLYYNVSKRTMEEWLSHYWNNFTVTLKHTEFYFSLIDFLESKKLNYAIVDLINDVPYRIEQCNILEKIENKGWLGLFEETYDFTPQISMYVDSIKNNKLYLNWHNLQNYDTFPTTNIKTRASSFMNINHIIHEYGIVRYKDVNHLLSTLPNDRHWNKLGNKLAGQTVAEFILKNYEDKK